MSSSAKANWLLHRRSQRAIGQGGFHTAELIPLELVTAQSPMSWSCTVTDVFNYVYDCGSRDTRKCHNEIESYVRALSRPQIDFLFLSHFDSDHVNGLPDLLDRANGARCHTVVIPFVDDVERLASFGRSVVRGKHIGTFFRELTADPIRTIGALGPRRIILMRSASGDPDDRAIIAPRGLDDDRDPDRSIHAKVSIDGQASLDTSSARTLANVQVASDDAAIEVAVPDHLWLLKPYIQACDRVRLGAFEREAERQLGWQSFSFRSRIKDASSRRQLVSDATSIVALANAYKVAFRDRNLTSMCLFSGPAQRSNMPLDRFFDFERSSQVGKIGWLGTGDISLKTLKHSDAFLAHFISQQNQVCAFGLPHHGSIRNYSSRVIAALQPTDCFVAAKPPRNWKHPHPAVTADVCRQKSNHHHVDDQASSAFHESFLTY